MSAKRWLNGSTSRNANRTCTPGSATRNSPSSSWRLRSRRSFSLSWRPLSLLCAEASMPRKGEPVHRRGGRRTGSFAYLEPDLDEPDLARVEPDFARDDPDREEPERDDVERDELDLAPVELDFARDEPDFARDELARERDEPDFALLDERDRLDAEPDFAREVDLRELLDPPFDALRERLVERRELERRRELEVPLRRSAAGISSRATAFASCGICFSRNLAIRSSSRLMPRASFAVSLSPTLSASASIPA